MPVPRILASHELTGFQIEALRRLMDRAFQGRFDDHDWDHALGGVHVVVEEDGTPLAHGALIERRLRVDGRTLRTGYVEAVAADPDRQGLGMGTAVMEVIGGLIRERFEIGGLGTGSQGFYERLGWRIWTGATAVVGPEGLRRTPDEDGYVMVLLTGATDDLDTTTGTLIADWREGDVW